MPPKLPLPHKRGPFSSFKITVAVKAITRQLRGENCLAAIFASRHWGRLSGPSGKDCRKISKFVLTLFDDYWLGPFPLAPFGVHWVIDYKCWLSLGDMPPHRRFREENELEKKLSTTLKQLNLLDLEFPGLKVSFLATIGNEIKARLIRFQGCYRNCHLINYWRESFLQLPIKIILWRLLIRNFAFSR